jgi:hypothetical protein
MKKAPKLAMLYWVLLQSLVESNTSVVEFCHSTRLVRIKSVHHGVLLPAETRSSSDKGEESVINSSGVGPSRSPSTAASSNLPPTIPQYVPANKWNALLQDPNVLIVDTRSRVQRLPLVPFQIFIQSPYGILSRVSRLDQYLVQQQTKEERQCVPCSAPCRRDSMAKGILPCRQVLAEESINTSVISTRPRQPEIGVGFDVRSNSTCCYCNHACLPLIQRWHPGLFG